LEIESQKTCGIGGLERAGLLGSDSQLDADLPRSLHERRGAVARGGQQQQQSGRGSYFFAAWK